jgi:small neutral amino acid transporter SnatA (MarC family)
MSFAFLIPQSVILVRHCSYIIRPYLYDQIILPLLTIILLFVLILILLLSSDQFLSIINKLGKNIFHPLQDTTLSLGAVGCEMQIWFSR